MTFKIKIGTAGNIDNGILKSLVKLKKLGLDGQEVEFVRGVRMGNSLAKEVGLLRKKLKLELSVHAPYYINLCSVEKIKIKDSMKRILKSCEKMYYLGGGNVVFHAAYYGKRSKKEVYDFVSERIGEMQDVIKDEGFKKVKLAPETTGKASQFGDLDELLQLVKETKCGICVDFAHLLARDGKIDYDSVMKKIKHLKHVHCHFSGIEFSAKGERRHLITKGKDIKELLSYLKKYKINCMIINESPNPLGDTLKTKKILEGMKLR
tara:strand:+ start:24099 stop:24890 length:792 start_codon:yes stop_codon:yes gene_type:complete